MSHKNQFHQNQYSIRPITAAVAAALAVPATALAQDQQDQQDEATRAGELEEVIVTARKRVENLQNVPASVQALPEAMLFDIGALNTEDYARFIPSITYLNFSNAGSNQIIFRGVNTGAAGYIGEASASVYLDEVSITQTGSQPNVRMMDINRVEALAGPQGTLYGAAAQSGTLRIHTNQPDPSQFEASVDTMLASGETSDTSYNVTGVLNMPLVEDVFAIRIAVQIAEDGGFIDNVPGHTPDGWWGYNIAYGVRSTWGTVDNSNAAEKNWNSVEYTAARIAARWDINDNWSATLTYNYNENEAQAGQDYNPFVGDLETIAFKKNYRKDKWDMWSLTIEGDLGFAQFVSATGFLDRRYDYDIDATIYYKYLWAWGCEERSDSAYYYWLWVNPATNQAIYYPKYCLMPGDPTVSPFIIGDDIGTMEGPEYNDKFSQEFRLSHQGETIDWLAGLYFEDSNDDWDNVWMKSARTPYQGTLSELYFTDFFGQTFPDAEYMGYFWDRTSWKQKAIFGELTWHINQDWHLTVGARWFETKNEKLYAVNQPGGYDANGLPMGFGTWRPGSTPEEGLSSGKESEWVPKANLQWNISDDKMMYALYSVGFRSGGVNRANARAQWDRTYFPQTFEPDKLYNYEIGAKTRWAENTVQLNLTWFYMDWKDFQTEVVDPSKDLCVDPALEPPCVNLPWLRVIGNVGDAHSTGFQAEFAWVPAQGWDIGANALWLEAEIDEDAGFESPIKKGQKLPNTPEFKAAAWATYTWPVEFVQGGEMFLRGQYSYTGKSENLLVPADPCCTSNPSFTNAAYSVADVRFGLISTFGDWQLDIFVNNITDERAEIYHGTGDFEWTFSRTNEYEHYHRIWTNRPREYGIRFTKRWGG